MCVCVSALGQLIGSLNYAVVCCLSVCLCASPICGTSLKIYLNAIAQLWHKLIAGFISGHVFYRNQQAKPTN